MKKRKLLIGMAFAFATGMMAIPNVFATENINSWNDFQTCLGDANQTTCKISASGFSAPEDGETIQITRQVIIDLNGATLTTPQKTYGFEIAAGANVTIQNGTIDTGEYNGSNPKAAIKMTGSTGDKTTKLTIAQNAIVKGTAGVKINNKASNNEGIVLDVQGEIRADKNQGNYGSWPIYVDGNLQSVTTLPKITVSGTLKNEVGTAAFYQGGLANTIITGTLIGGTGAAIKAGIVNFNNATVIANGQKENPEVSGNGVNYTGAAIQVSSVGNYAAQPPMEIYINGGSYTSENANAIEVFGDEDAVEITLTGDVKLSAPNGEVFSSELTSFEGIKNANGEVINFGDTTIWPIVDNSKKDVPSTSNNKEETNPNTSDSILSSIVISIVGLVCLTSCGIYYKKRFQ